MADKFSNKQRQLFLNALKNNGGKPVPLLNHPKCTKCTGQQNVEMTCKFCEVTKGLDQFSKNQRNNPDEAVCRLALAMRNLANRIKALLGLLSDASRRACGDKRC